MKSIPSLVLALSAGPLIAGPVLYSIGGDDFGVTRRLTQLDTNASAATALFDLGDGSAVFTGLTFNNTLQLFYAVRTDAFGNSSLVSFNLAGGGVDLLALTLSSGGLQPFNGGLVTIPGNSFYAIANDGSPDSEVFSIDMPTSAITQRTLRLGPGYTGGLTLNPIDGFLYALRNDSFGNSTLIRLDLSGGPGAVNAVNVVSRLRHGLLRWPLSRRRGRLLRPRHRFIRSLHAQPAHRRRIPHVALRYRQRLIRRARALYLRPPPSRWLHLRHLPIAAALKTRFSFRPPSNFRARLRLCQVTGR